MAQGRLDRIVLDGEAPGQKLAGDGKDGVGWDELHQPGEIAGPPGGAKLQQQVMKEACGVGEMLLARCHEPQNPLMLLQPDKGEREISPRRPVPGCGADGARQCAARRGEVAGVVKRENMLIHGRRLPRHLHSAKWLIFG
jgi:hypothetical protein